MLNNRMISIAAALATFASAETATANDSVYTDLDFDACQTILDDEFSDTMKCPGYQGLAVYFTESDLRQAMQYGPVRDELVGKVYESFAPFNRVGSKIEWRLDAAGKPIATILRWYIENTGPEGEPTEESTGQVLVVSRIARPDDGLSCVIGYVDALENRDANMLARQIADNEAHDFACGYQERFWRGKRGEKSGEPTIVWPEGYQPE